MTARLWWSIASLEARTTMSYRLDFWLNALVAPLSQFVIAYCLWSSIFAESGQTTIAGYGMQGIIAYYLAAILLGRLTRGKEKYDLISAEIYEGSLNRYLLFPASYLPFKYAQHIGQTAPQLVQATVIAALALAVLRPPQALAALADPALVARVATMTVLAIALGNLLHFLALSPLEFVAFWADNVWSLCVAHRMAASLLGGLMVPLAVFPDWGLAILRWLPFQFYFDVPARALLGQLGWPEFARTMAIGLGWCAIFGTVAHLVWNRGKYRYSGVGI